LTNIEASPQPNSDPLKSDESMRAVEQARPAGRTSVTEAGDSDRSP
jgi:hypothetical protein